MDIVSKVMSLLFNTQSRFAIAFLSRSRHFLISWLAVSICSDFGAPENKSCHCFHFFPICHEVVGPDARILVFWMLFQASSLLLPSSKGFLVPLQFLPLEWYHPHIWSCWYFSQQSWLQLGIHPVQHFTWCTLHRSEISRVTIYSLAILIYQFGTSLLFHVQF